MMTFFLQEELILGIKPPESIDHCPLAEFLLFPCTPQVCDRILLKKKQNSLCFYLNECQDAFTSIWLKIISFHFFIFFFCIFCSWTTFQQNWAWFPSLDFRSIFFLTFRKNSKTPLLKKKIYCYLCFF